MPSRVLVPFRVAAPVPKVSSDALDHPWSCRHCLLFVPSSRASHDAASEDPSRPSQPSPSRDGAAGLPPGSLLLGTDPILGLGCFRLAASQPPSIALFPFDFHLVDAGWIWMQFRSLAHGSLRVVDNERVGNGYRTTGLVEPSQATKAELHWRPAGAGRYLIRLAGLARVRER
ncbi:uncharacterized protein BKA78DRAFT_295352 [Phyllosticta capitalensis]|uniref:uncharacterized protein n=1 Tax=Phyllosticta capitalensis TaxID=121624 RepID=UPI00312D1791